MARKIKKRSEKPVIFIFWEGESEEAYSKFLKNNFLSKANITIHNEKGLFDTANAAFRGNVKYRNAKEEIDEVWFFFDTEIEKGQKWNEVLQYIAKIRKFNKRIRVRLLMTTACIEYFFMLHYRQISPSLATPADKVRMEEELKKIVKDYKKGNKEKIWEIANNYEVAIEYGEWSLNRIEDELPTLEDCDERNSKLYRGEHTFTTVHEALKFLRNLKS